MAKKKQPPATDGDDVDAQKKTEKYKDTPQGQQERWGVEFVQAKEFHRNWRERGKMAVSKYLDKNSRTTDAHEPEYKLPLFTSNINTTMAMLFGRVPQVSVDRRWADPKDQVARVAAEIAERVLNSDIEIAGEDFSSILRAALQDRLIPGVGVVRLRYNFDESEDEDQEDADEKSPKADEWIEDVYVPWEDIYWSPCRYWKEMRWIAFRLFKTKSEVIEFLGGGPGAEKIAERLDYTSKAPLENATQKSSETWDKVEMWEIWDKTKKTVYWYVEGAARILKKVEDPLELEEFFPCPPFFIANVTTKEYIPKSDYSFAAPLYREIDRLEERIALLTQAVKMLGVYDKKAGQDIGRLVNDTAENKLIPVDSWAVFQERGGLKGSIEFLPIEEVARVIEILQAQQERRIQQLNQVTGMQDILRGVSEGDRSSATQKKFEAKFASVRLQAVQDEFTQFATNLQKLRFEIIVKHFDAESIIKHANIMNTDDASEAIQAVQLLKDVELSKWRIQIQPESMAMIDYAQLKQERTEYINSLGIFFQSSLPVAEKFPEAAPMLMELLKWGLAGFKGGKQIEGVLDRTIAQMEEKAKNPQPPKPDPEMMKAQAQIQIQQEKHQADLEQTKVDAQAKQADQAQAHQLKMAELQAEFTAKLQTLRLELHQAHTEHVQSIQKSQQEMKQTTHETIADVIKQMQMPVPQVPDSPEPKLPETSGGQIQ